MTLLIKNVRLLGSDGGAEEKADVFVSGETISAVGDFRRKGADEVIDGQGGYLAPGFIDVDTTSDHYLSLFDDPEQGDFLKQGVTTIVGGHCGASLAPLLYGTLEALRKWGDVGKVNVDWHTVGEFLERLSRQPLGVNFATFAGHATIRRAILGESVRDLTKNEIEVFNGILRRAMTEGAFGLSTGLEYVHARGTPYQELVALLKTVAAGGGMHAVHVRDTGAGIATAFKEAVKLAKETGVATIVDHFMPLLEFPEAYRDAAEILDGLPSEIKFSVSVHPWGGSMMPFYRLLPQWAQNGNLEVMARGVQDDWLARRILKELPAYGPGDFVIAEAPGQNILVGETLGSFMHLYEIDDPRRALLKLFSLTGLRGVAYVHNIDRRLADPMLAHPRAFIVSHAASVARDPKRKAFRSPRVTDTFPEYLRRVTRKGLLSLPEAVRKITAAPAAAFGLANRGWIRAGYAADLVVFNDFKVSAVVVNGAVAVRDGALTAARRGRPISHRSS